MIFVLYLIHSVPKDITPVCPTLGATLDTNDTTSLRPIQHAPNGTPSIIQIQKSSTSRPVLSRICLSAFVDWNIGCPGRTVSSYCVDRGGLFLLAVQLLLLRQ
jgi:hypothetical protein